MAWTSRDLPLTGKGATGFGVRLLDRLVAEGLETATALTEVGFYHLTRSTLEEALPRLLEKAYAAGNRVRGARRATRSGWSCSTGPCGPTPRIPSCRTAPRSDGFAEEQPIYLTAQVENPNGATILVLVDGAAAPDLGARSTAASTCSTAATPRRWPAPASAGARSPRPGHGCTYWQQSERGGWARGADVRRPASLSRSQAASL